jgi:hypothetical protein
MFNQIIDRTLANYDVNAKLVTELMEFDRIILNYVISALEQHEEKIKNAGIKNQYLSIEVPLKELKYIRENDSLRIKYKAVINQGIVLLVSYFSSSVSELFCEFINHIANTLRPKKLLNERIELSIEELLLQNREEYIDIAGFIVQSKDISFQDMKSVGRVFKDYLNYEPMKDIDVNNIIVAQACRHAIVHSGAVVDQKLITQLKDAQPRDVKVELTLKEVISFNKREIEVCAKSMRNYIEKVSNGIVEVWK